MAEYENIIVELSENVATIRLNRPHALNAATPQMFDELRTAFDGLKPAGARALVITGSGRGFCSGADLGDGDRSSGSPGTASRRRLQQHYNPGLLALTSLEMPVICAVNGAAAGIGCSLALAGNFIFAGRSAYFLQAFSNIGLVPDGGSTWLLPNSIGIPASLAMMMTGERLYAEEAERKGLITRCVDDEELLSEADAMARRLASGPTVAFGLIRQLVRSSAHMSLTEAMNREAEAQKRAGDTADFEEGVRAFREKRKPQFKGS